MQVSNRRFGKDGDDGFREALQPVDDGDENVLYAPGLQLIHDAQHVEFGASFLLDEP